ncbi:lytic transglycosylase domain-containing protein [Burkholderia latens]|uniref:lytic transglycosylase domain-containing protein n=1 Tax=Burkholderia latens TaxID=488446 RepID=UPI001FC80549|nr:lytic transglycosylase domain-containing protein [Burkholderia latens]
MVGIFGQAHADCINDAAKLYNVNPDVLRSIAYYESHLNPEALNHNENGTTDFGLMQINSVHLPTLRREGIGRSQLMQPTVNARVGAAILHDAINQYGPTWQAVGAYHSRTPALSYQYAEAIHHIFLTKPWQRACASSQSASTSVGVDVTALRLD